MDWDRSGHKYCSISRRFQFPSRNSMDWDRSGHKYCSISGRFQFPSRNSMDWDPSRDCGPKFPRCGFNSPVGIRWIGTSSKPRVQSLPTGFNSPVGIRWIGTWGSRCGRWRLSGFQFPSRNSMFAFLLRGPVSWRVVGVSIPQSEFDGLGRLLPCFMSIQN